MALRPLKPSKAQRKDKKAQPQQQPLREQLFQASGMLISPRLVDQPSQQTNP